MGAEDGELEELVSRIVGSLEKTVGEKETRVGCVLGRSWVFLSLRMTAKGQESWYGRGTGCRRILGCERWCGVGLARSDRRSVVMQGLVADVVALGRG